MKMKRKALFVGLMALLAASGVTAFLYYLVADRLIEPTVVEASTQQPVIVAARGIARGVRLDESDLFIETRDVEQIPPGAYDSIDRLTGKLVVQPVAEGELLLPGHFPATGNGGLSSAIPPGMRAVSLHVEEYAGVTQIVEVGDRVDVHVASGCRSPGRGEITLRTLSQSLEVLSTGREFAEDRRKAIPVVTVLVASEHAARAGGSGWGHTAVPAESGGRRSRQDSRRGNAGGFGRGGEPRFQPAEGPDQTETST